jgi:hypothetical protein
MKNTSSCSHKNTLTVSHIIITISIVVNVYLLVKEINKFIYLGYGLL